MRRCARGQPWLSLVLVGATFGADIEGRYLAHEPPTLPAIAALDPYAAFFDRRPTRVTVTANWHKLQFSVSRHEFLRDATIWQRMYFDDWDSLDEHIRRAGLSRLLQRYGGVVRDRTAWTTMTAQDWDAVPHPVRAMAILTMIEEWAAIYTPGAVYGLDPALVLQSIKAIALSESWLDHRAIGLNRDGSVDIGIGGASAFARRTMRRAFKEGWCDFDLEEHQYYNPWLAARWLVFWFDLMLIEADGNLGLAIRAHNRGIGRAADGAGQAYLDGVRRRRAEYFESPGPSPTWRELRRWRVRALRRPA